MQYLNLDEFKPAVEKTVTLGGVKYDVEELSVEDFIVTVQEAKKLKEVKDVDAQVEASVKVCQRYLPRCPVDLLRKLKLEQLGALIAFCQDVITTDDRGMPVIKNEEAPEAAEAVEGAEKK